MIKNNDKKNFIWNFVGLTFNSFSSFFFLIIVNQCNGKEEAGIFTFSYSLICLLYFIAAYYNRTYQIADTTKKFNNREYIYHRIISCLLMILITVLFLLIADYSYFKSIIILLLCFYRLIEAFCDSLFGILQRENELYKCGISLFIKGFLGVVIFFIIDYFTKNLIIATFSLTLVNLSVLLLYDFNNIKKYIESEGNIKKSLLIFKQAFPIFVFSILNVYLVNSAKYTLDIYENNLIQNIFGIILMPGTILSLCCQYLLNPHILKLTNFYKDGEFKSFNNILIKVSCIIIGVCIIGEIVCYTFGIPVLNFIYDVEINEYTNLLAMIILGSALLAIVSILSNALTIIHKNKVQMYIYLITSVISLVISFILIQNYSITGAALTYLITMFIQLIIYIIVYIIDLRKEERKYLNGK